MSVDRSRLPALGAEPAFTFPEIRRQTLGNGVRAWTVEHHDVPIVSALMIIPAGASADPGDRPGLAAITGDLLDEGCGELDALALHDALGRIGAHLDTEVGADATVLAVTALERFAPPALRLLAEMAIQPRLEDGEFTRVRDLRLNRLIQLRDMPPALADRAFARMLYGSHPYGHLSLGTEESLRALTVDEVRQFHGAAYRARRATVVAVGDASHDRLASLIDEAFGRWPAPSSPGISLPDVTAAGSPAAPAARLQLVHRPGAAQSELRIGHVSAPRTHPDYHALVVLNLVLGGQFVSRINMNLREDKGFTYGARTSFDFRRGPGPFVLQASVQSDATAAAVRESLFEVAAIRGERPVTRQELELGRAAVTRGYPRNFETADHVARAAAQLALYDLPDDYFTTFVPKVLSLSEADVTRAAAAHLDPDRLAVVIVGDRDAAGAGLEELGLGSVVEVAQT
jgi:predicted Zn-dependent peptidase